jgi:hypothetical protein
MPVATAETTVKPHRPMNNENRHSTGLKPGTHAKAISFLIMNCKPLQTESFEKLTGLFKQLAEITSELQLEISRALVENPVHKADLLKQMKTSENDMQLRVDRAVHGFVRTMPLASMNRQNLFMEALALHSNLTGNPLVHELLEEVNRQIFAEYYD